jgi:hypothetical protein
MEMKTKGELTPMAAAASLLAAARAAGSGQLFTGIEFSRAIWAEATGAIPKTALTQNIE